MRSKMHTVSYIIVACHATRRIMWNWATAWCLPHYRIHLQLWCLLSYLLRPEKKLSIRRPGEESHYIRKSNGMHITITSGSSSLSLLKRKGGICMRNQWACSSLAFLCEGAFWTYDEPISNLWSPSAVAWTWAAYCRFQSTSSMEGLADDCGDKHLFIMEITIDRDSWEQVLKMIGSMMPFLSSWLLSDLSYGTETKETCQCSRS